MTVPVYEYVVMALVVVSVRVPVKLVMVVNIIEELCLGPTDAATELLKQEAKATTAIELKTMLEMTRDAFNQAFSEIALIEARTIFQGNRARPPD